MQRVDCAFDLTNTNALPSGSPLSSTRRAPIGKMERVICRCEGKSMGPCVLICRCRVRRDSLMEGSRGVMHCRRFIQLVRKPCEDLLTEDDVVGSGERKKTWLVIVCDELLKKDDIAGNVTG